MDWKNEKYFKRTEKEIDFYIHASKDKYEYMNLNPTGQVGQGDQLFQIIRKLRPKMSASDIMHMIVTEKIKRGIMRLDVTAYKKIIKEIFSATEKKINGATAQTFEIEEGEWAIVRFGTQIELFNIKEKKYYSCHSIGINKKVTGYWVIEEEYGK